MPVQSVLAHPLHEVIKSHLLQQTMVTELGQGDDMINIREFTLKITETDNSLEKKKIYLAFVMRCTLIAGINHSYLNKIKKVRANNEMITKKNVLHQEVVK